MTRDARAMRQTVTWELGLQNITWLIEDAVIERSERVKTQPPTCR